MKRVVLILAVLALTAADQPAQKYRRAYAVPDDGAADRQLRRGREAERIGSERISVPGGPAGEKQHSIEPGGPRGPGPLQQRQLGEQDRAVHLVAQSVVRHDDLPISISWKSFSN